MRYTGKIFALLFLTVVGGVSVTANAECSAPKKPSQPRDRLEPLKVILLDHWWFKGGCPEFEDDRDSLQQALGKDIIVWSLRDSDKRFLHVCLKDVDSRYTSSPICAGSSCYWHLPQPLDQSGAVTETDDVDYNICLTKDEGESCSSQSKMKCMDPVIIIHKGPDNSCWPPSKCTK